MDFDRNGEYEEFRVFPDRGPAESMCSWLESEGVPSCVEARALSCALSMSSPDSLALLAPLQLERGYMDYITLNSSNGPRGWVPHLTILNTGTSMWTRVGRG